MGLHEMLLDLDAAVNRLSRGVCAVQAMSLGLDQAIDPYADGLSAVCEYLIDADREVHRQLELCLNTI